VGPEVFPVLRKILGGALLATLAACFQSDGTPPPLIPPPAVATITLSRDTATLVPNTTVQLSASLFDEGGKRLKRPIVWVSSDPAKATVSNTGLVTGLLAGAAQISATSEAQTRIASIVVKDGGVVGNTGATLNAQSGTATLVIPQGALTQSTTVTIEPTTDLPIERRLVTGSVDHQVRAEQRAGRSS
jgi:hypothetical protein